MDDVLLGIVLQRLDEEPLPEEASGLLLAALDGDEALSDQLSSAPGAWSAPAGRTSAASSPVGAYLRSLSVSGFRGIGPKATLEVAPGPGLTVVVGRNGSGKSSFAEGLEVLLTGALLRWDNKTAIWRDGWRSKHAPNAAEIGAEVLVEGSGAAVVTRNWPDGADFGGSTAWLQRAGEKRSDIAALGWTNALNDHRPFFSHAELEAFFGRPSELHDLLASVLGLEDLAAADTRLKVARKAREDALVDIKQRLQELRTRLEQVDDERAKTCLAVLRGTAWDLDAARAVATGNAVTDGGQLERLRRLAQLTVPAAQEISDAATGLRTAADQLDAVAGTAAGQAKVLAGLLASALEHHRSHGDGDCPVCGRLGALTPTWQEATQQQVTRLREEARATDAATTAAAQMVLQAQGRMSAPPKILSDPVPEDADSEPVREAWARWAKPPATDVASPVGLRALADHLDGAFSLLAQAAKALTASAVEELARRDDRWGPVAAAVASWCADADPAIERAKPVPSIKKARAWLVSATGDLRNARLAPLADQARDIWAMLRQESNVDLGAFRLAGTATQRKLELDVSIDGTPGAALGVMSQGEINALALSIFLPRATMPDSPFRFLVIDDPVQAMDPAKVDGLARVLEKVAADRQVIVFTHDNRLVSAVKDLNIPAMILEVTRRPKSIVHVRSCLDPVEQALKDAGALNADQALPAGVAVRVVPGLCRTAVEAALTQTVWRQQLRAGRGRDEIEADLTDARRRLINLAALALFGDAGQGAKVLPRLDGWGHIFANTFQALNRGSHQQHVGDLGYLISDSRKLAAKFRDIAP